MPCLILTYATLRGISERAAWKALRAAVDAGWVRCTQKAAPGYTARYELQLPVDLVPNELPEDLARALRLWAPDSLPEPDHTDTRVGHLTLVPPISTTAPVPDDDEVQTSPSYAKALSPLWSSTFPIPGAMSRYEGPPPRRGARREPIRLDEIEAAREVLARCGSWWSQQRGTGAGSLSAAEVEALLGPVAYALRRATPNELVELMTIQTRSARSLPHVVGARLWKLIRSRTEHYRQRDVPADETGERYSSMLARRARRQDAVTVRTANLRSDLRERIELQAMDSRLAADPPWQVHRSWAREDEAAHAGERAFADLVRDAAPVEVYRACVERSRRERRPSSRKR
ncbi:hypothetical protein [Actinacidiphila glaucinigra]|uniref:hypothetical protein n=1 Tax=Actinacidiphila glaucinigra TaxID=235986 RepID=UPI003717B650